MAPIKASLEANVRYLAKSFSSFSSVRLFGQCRSTQNICLHIRYLKNYLFAENLPQKKAHDKEVANTAVFFSVMFFWDQRSRNRCGRRDGVQLFRERSGRFRNGN